MVIFSLTLKPPNIPQASSKQKLNETRVLNAFYLGEHATTINFKGLPTDEDMITVGMNIKMTRDRCRQIIEEVKALL